MDILFDAVLNLASLSGMFYLLLGVLVGLLFGAMPGVGGSTALAILIPLTFGMQPADAILLLGGVMGANEFGGSLTSILINTPGTSTNAATCLDGHPMARQGKAGMAIGAAAAASTIGGWIGIAVLLVLLPFAKTIILSFGPPEFFLLAIAGLAAVALSTGQYFLKGLIAGGFGLLLAMVGFDDMGGGQRYTLGIDYLWDGISIMPMLIGVFAIAEMIKLAVDGGKLADDTDVVVTGVMDGIKAVFKNLRTLVQGSLIGTLIGLIPGVGGTVTAFVSYSAAKQTSKDPESFGKGNIVGVIAPEAAINAKDGGSLVPTLAFGIPGGAETAIFLGAMVIHGLQPGPMLLIEHEYVIFSLILSLSLSCLLASLIGIASARYLTHVTRLDITVLVPIVLAIAFVGTYAVQSSLGDVLLALAFGVVGYFMLKFNFPRVTMIIGLVLGSLAERSFHQSLMISRGDYGVFVATTISKVLIALLILAIGVFVYQRLKHARRLA